MIFSEENEERRKKLRKKVRSGPRLVDDDESRSLFGDPIGEYSGQVKAPKAITSRRLRLLSEGL